MFYNTYIPGELKRIFTGNVMCSANANNGRISLRQNVIQLPSPISYISNSDDCKLNSVLNILRISKN